MIKAIFKTVGVAAALIATPILLLIVGLVFMLIGPVAGVLMIIFLPMVIAGVIIGWTERSKKQNKED